MCIPMILLHWTTLITRKGIILSPSLRTAITSIGTFVNLSEDWTNRNLKINMKYKKSVSGAEQDLATIQVGIQPVISSPAEKDQELQWVSGWNRVFTLFTSQIRHGELQQDEHGQQIKGSWLLPLCIWCWEAFTWNTKLSFRPPVQEHENLDGTQWKGTKLTRALLAQPMTTGRWSWDCLVWRRKATRWGT